MYTIKIIEGCLFPLNNSKINILLVYWNLNNSNVMSELEKKLDVVVVGGIGVDTNIYLPGRDIDFSVESNYTENIDYVGQAGGFATRGFAQLGYKTGLIDYIGLDHNADFIKKELEKDGVECLFFYDPKGTRRSINFMYKDGRRKNFYDGKSHMELELDIEICREFLKKSRIIHFNLMNWSRKLLPIVKELGLSISCDLQDIIDLKDSYRDDFINYADVVFFSNVNFRDPKPLIQSLLRKKQSLIVVVGMGAEGAALGLKDKISYFLPIRVIKDPVIDTNGAGDGLAVGFLSSYFLEGFSLEDSVQRGQIVARYTCTIKGSSSSLITKKKLSELFSQIG